MPEIKFKKVVSFSSEDAQYPASNLLLTDSYRKWRGAAAGEKELTIVLQLEETSRISAVHVGNDGAAFVEVLVGKLGADLREFRVLLPTSSFMSPKESRDGAPVGRVRMFAADKLDADVCRQGWDCVRVVCTQPFSRAEPYGLAFCKLFAPDDKPPASEDRQSVPPRLGADSGGGLALGAFTLKPENPVDDILPGRLFNRRNAPASSSSDSSVHCRPGAAAVNGVRAKPELVGRSVATTDAALPLRQSSEPTATVNRNGASPSVKPSPQTAPRRKEEPSRRANPASTSSLSSPRPATSKPHQNADSRRNSTTPSVVSRENSARPSPKGTHQRKDGIVRKADTSDGEAAARRRNPTRTPATPAASAIYSPLNRLLAGVVFTMSGYQNPRRSDLRDMALRLGARYRPDWDARCTHLVCAFTNTPKFTQAVGSSGAAKIVRGEWLEACSSRKCRLPWRRHALVATDRTAPESDGEVWAEELRPPTTPSDTASVDVADSQNADEANRRDLEEDYDDEDEDANYDPSSEEMDTDDEIQDARANIATADPPRGRAHKPRKRDVNKSESSNKVKRTATGQATVTCDEASVTARVDPASVPSTSSEALVIDSSSATEMDTDDEIQATIEATVFPRRDAQKTTKDGTGEETASSAKVIQTSHVLTPVLDKSPSARISPSSSVPSTSAEPMMVIDSDDDAAYDADTDLDSAEELPRNDFSDIPELPDFFSGRKFFLHGDTMDADTRRQAERFVVAFGGDLLQYCDPTVRYVLTEDCWDANFDEALADNPDVLFVRPDWLFECNSRQKLVPAHAFLVSNRR